MCGIAGFFDPDRRIDPARYEAIAGAMADRLAHRGPDGRGLWCDARRPASRSDSAGSPILDLSPAGDQPMQSADGRIVMVFNGEIYNHHDLRRALDEEGARQWRGHSDSEVLVEAIARWGIGADARARERHVRHRRVGPRARGASPSRATGSARSRWRMAGSAACCCSHRSLSALAPHPAWTGELDRGALGLFLRHGYIPAPWTAFAGMRKLAPGGFVEIAADRRRPRPRAYWSAPRARGRGGGSAFCGTMRGRAPRRCKP